MLSQSHIRGLLQSIDFSEGTGTTLNDKSGNGNNATVIGGTWTADRFGRSNRAILLDGVDDYIDLGLANYQGDVSALVSVKLLASYPSSRAVINKGYKDADEFPPNFRTLFLSDRRMATSNKTDAGGTDPAVPANINTAVNFGTWNMIYVAYKNAIGGTHGANGLQSTGLSAGVNAIWSNRPFLIGKVDDVATYSAFTVDRIMLFNRFLSGHELSKISNRLKIGDLDK